MHTFTLTTANNARCALLLADKKITESEIKRKCGLYNMDYYNIQKSIQKAIDTHPSFVPLTNDIYSSNIQCIMHFFLLLDEDSGDSHDFEDNNSLYAKCFIDYSELNFPREALFWVLTGGFVISLLKDDFIELDWLKYEFSDPYTMYYALGAYLHNIASDHDERVTFTAISNNILNTFPNNINGDFRFEQYNCLATTLNNPFSEHECDEILPFGLPSKLGSIIGYHSVEMAFFAGLLLFAKNTATRLECATNVDAFISQFPMNEHKLGNFGDAGMYSRGLSGALLIESAPLPFIVTEGDIIYQPEIQDRELHYTEINHNNDTAKPTGIIIKPDMLDDLIKQLFIKVHNGNGRSSLPELIEGLNFFIKKQKSS